MNQTILEQNIQNIRPKLMTDTFGLEACIEDLCSALIIEYFQRGNIFVPEKSVSIDEIKNKLSILPKFEKMISLFTKVLKQKQLLSVNDTTLTPEDKLFDFGSSEYFLEKIRILYPKYAYYLTFVSECAKKYYDVLSGKLPGTALLYPAGDTGKLERLYKNTPKLGYEEVFLHTVKEIIKQTAKKSTSYSVLEIGGGQGILTNVLHPLVGNCISNYCFSDISKMFVDQAKTRLTKPEYTFDVVDCTDEQQLQNMPESYDMVVGFNVIHATPDISQTLSNLSKVVKDGGKMLFVENIKQEIWIDMLYGMVDGWWTFDDEYRTTSPLLTLPQWNELLGKANFTNYEVLPGMEERESFETGCIIINK